jgi:hypothetical protein
VDRSGCGEIIRRMEVSNLIVRHALGNYAEISLTPKGKQYLADARALINGPSPPTGRVGAHAQAGTLTIQADVFRDAWDETRRNEVRQRIVSILNEGCTEILESPHEKGAKVREMAADILDEIDGIFQK